MSQEVFIRGLFSGIMSLAFAWLVFSRYDHEIGDDGKNTEGQKYLPYANGALLPVFLLSLTILAYFEYGATGAVKMSISGCFSIFLQICIYYIVLLAILPLLRKIISARACAMLWLIPNYLYILFQGFMEPASPLLVITAPGKSAFILFGIWLIGFTGVILWKVAEHLIFRRRILRDAKLITDEAVIAVWDALIEDARFRKPKFKLVSSPAVSTPLTIGLFQRTTRVVLPEKIYSNEDLELLLRHELIHIGRGDAWNKFFMVFCTAMCWFNPFVWVAMRKSADDLELSCDETVLLDADDAARKQYAILLLDTAGDERGFTTCLSASAKAMRYRLKSVTKPGKRRSGALIVGLVFFALCMTSGYVALAYDGNGGDQLLYQSTDYSGYTIRNISMRDDAFNTKFEIRDEAAFHAYLAGLTVYDLTGSYSFSDSQRYYTIILDTPTGTQTFTLYDDVVKLVWISQIDRPAEFYYVPGGLDWDYLDTLIVPQPALNVHLKEANDVYGRNLHTWVNCLWRIENGSRILIHEAEYPDGEHHGLFTREPYPYEATFQFSQELTAPFTVLVESWDYSQSYTVSQADLQDGCTMTLPNYPAHYTIHANLRGQDGTEYEAEFWFNIGAVESE